MKGIVVFLIMISANLTAVAGQKVINKDVVDMINLGLSESVIITKIQHSETDFDTSSKSLKLLQDSGASSAIITVII